MLEVVEAARLHSRPHGYFELAGQMGDMVHIELVPMGFHIAWQRDNLGPMATLVGETEKWAV